MHSRELHVQTRMHGPKASHNYVNKQYIQADRVQLASNGTAWCVMCGMQYSAYEVCKSVDRTTPMFRRCQGTSQNFSQEYRSLVYAGSRYVAMHVKLSALTSFM